ncbi:MAG TPA: aminotransferase class V-fold PLP-dependent enzyme, partial [Alphaproteobacteria bacterium]
MIQEDLYKSWSSHWEFKTPLYMNHGSFGAAPKAVNDLKMELECEMTRDPQGHFWNELRESYDEARQTIAAFVNAPVADVVLLDNATEALNVVLKSRHFAPGDQILMTNHGYPPFHDLMKEFSRRTGVEVIVARIPFPVMSEADVIDAILQCATARTRLAVIDHISSPTALVFPITDIVQRLNHQGIDTFVDGAHGIGHLQLDMQEIGTAYYASNNHKWLCAPLSSAFLYVRPCRQDKIIPLCGSKGSTKDHPFAERFAWQGTKNMAARLCLPETIRYMAA